MDISLDVQEDRELAYVFLSQAFLQEPSVQQLEVMSCGGFGTGEKMAVFCKSLTDVNLEQVHIDLAAEFASLVLGMSAHPLAPYESVYSNENRLMMQDARDEVLAAYRMEGFDEIPHLNLPEDHISIEFEFMVQLCRKTIMSIKKGDSVRTTHLLCAQSAFLRDHLLRWIPRFCDELQRRAKTDFYQGLAQIARTMVEGDARYLAREMADH